MSSKRFRSSSAKFLCANFQNFLSISKFPYPVAHRLPHAQQHHSWEHQREFYDRQRKLTPRIRCMRQPWKFLATTLNFWRLRWFCDPYFRQREFIRGSKKAAAVMTETVRQQDINKIRKFTSPIGFQQISRDMLLLRADPRHQLVRFEEDHLQHALPMAVSVHDSKGKKHCFVDMFFIGVRNIKDFDTPEEVVKMMRILRQVDDEEKTSTSIRNMSNRIIYSELCMRFRRVYSEDNGAATASEQTGWTVSFYKVIFFEILNYLH